MKSADGFVDKEQEVGDPERWFFKSKRTGARANHVYVESLLSR